MAQEGSGKFAFKAEVRQLLDILVHSLYTNHEIFLRELVSNASDALDKLRFHTASGQTVADPQLPLEIRIRVDPEAKTVTIEDTGVGMTRDELVKNIGTIAHSGTSEFMRAAQKSGEKPDASASGGTTDDAGGNASTPGLDSLIGRFGVGFYSVFMAAREVVLTTRSWQPDATAWQWRSDGLGSYRLDPAPEGTTRGTRIEVQLRDEAARFADADFIKDVLLRHSGFIGYPLVLNGERVNTVAALWREPKFSITPERYAEFYRFITRDVSDPLETIHLAIDAPVQFSALLFVPAKGEDLQQLRSERPGLDLYVRKVLIQRDNHDLLPEYLGFLRGVVDAEDLPLNISRETLQENVLLRKISQTLVNHVYSHLERLSLDKPEEYAAFWREHGRIFTFGYGDYTRRERFAALLRFASSALPPQAGTPADEDADGAAVEPITSLADYVTRVRPGQKTIYYATGQSRSALGANPHLELFRRKGLEVLYLYEAVDEFALDAVRTYKDFDLKSVEHANPDDLAAFPDLEGQAERQQLTEQETAALDGLLAKVQEILGQRVTEVRASKRLVGSPAVLVSADGRITSAMQKVMRVWSKESGAIPKVLEINPEHPLTRNLLAVFQAGPDDDYLRLAVEQLFEAALLQDGYLDDPQAMVNRMQELLTRSSAWYREKLGRSDEPQTPTYKQ